MPSVPPRVRLLLLAVLAAACALPVPGAAAAPKTLWLCKPGMKRNPCEPSLKTTRFTPTGKRLGVDRIRLEKRPAIDCFYVYPTVSDQKRALATRVADPEIRSMALFQAARYSQRCRVFAPLYRQATLRALNGGRFDLDTPYVSVRDAWHDYLRRYNHGRGVVLVGHSQGTFVLRRLLAREVDRKRSLRRRIVSAILLGGNVEVKKGSDRGGDFRNIPACRSRSQIGCVIAFSSFENPVPDPSVFGRAATPGREVLCTNPAALRGGSAPLTSIYPTTPFAPGSTIALAIGAVGANFPKARTPWVAARGSYSGRCSHAGGADVLQLTPHGKAAKLNLIPNPGWGTHLADGNIALGDLLALVRSQTAAYLRR